MYLRLSIGLVYDDVRDVAKQPQNASHEKTEDKKYVQRSPFDLKTACFSGIWDAVRMTTFTDVSVVYLSPHVSIDIYAYI